MEREFYKGIDLLRAFACLLVILTHSCECYYISNFYAAGSFESLNIAAWQSEALQAVLIDSLSHCCVPLFVMISGFLLLPLPQGMTMGEFYRKRAMRILVPLAVWTIVYSVYCTVRMSDSLAGTADYLLSFLRGLGYFFINFPAPIGHLWYVYMILGLYLIAPILSPWVERASRREMQVVLGIWLALTLVPVMRLRWPELWGECPWNPFGAQQYLTGFIGYFLAGAYARKYLYHSEKSYRGVGWTLTIVGFLLAAAGVVYQVYCVLPTADTYGNYFNNTFELSWFFCGLPMCLETFGIFLLCFRLSPKRVPSVLTDFSRKSYGIYLCHIMFLTWLYEHVFASLSCPATVSILAITLGTIVSSYLLIKLLSYLPHSKWIIG